MDFSEIGVCVGMLLGRSHLLCPLFPALEFQELPSLLGPWKSTKAATSWEFFIKISPLSWQIMGFKVTRNIYIYTHISKYFKKLMENMCHEKTMHGF